MCSSESQLPFCKAALISLEKTGSLNARPRGFFAVDVDN